MPPRANPLWIEVTVDPDGRAAIEVERRCPRCHPLAPGCPDCGGTGIVLTAAGAKLIAFVFRHVEAHQDLIAEQVDRLEAERMHPFSIVRGGS